MNWSSGSVFCVVFLGPGAIAELVPIFHVALHALHAAHFALPTFDQNFYYMELNPRSVSLLYS
jgi:hypothetical protein